MNVRNVVMLHSVSLAVAAKDKDSLDAFSAIIPLICCAVLLFEHADPDWLSTLPNSSCQHNEDDLVHVRLPIFISCFLASPMQVIFKRINPREHQGSNIAT